MYQIKLKNYFLMALTAVLLSCGQNSTPASNDTRVLAHEDTLPYEPNKSTVAQNELSSVTQIQQQYNAIVTAYKNAQLDSVSFKYNCDGEKSGTVSYFSEKGNLKLIKHSYAEYDHHEMVDQYFIEGDVPFFAHLKSLSWSFDSGPEGATKDAITEQRIYLSDWKAIKCLQKKYEIRLHAGVNPKPEQVPNKEVDCASSQSIEKPYRLLAKYWKTSPPKCLTN